MILSMLTLLAAAAAPSDDVTVTADKLPPEAIAPAARAFVDNMLPVPVQGQYARWQAPICPKIIGVEDAVAARVTRRIAAVAQEARIAVAPNGCTPNLIVWFSQDARRDVAAILGKKPLSAEGVSPEDRKRLLEAPMPVRWWHATQAGSSDGSGMTRTASATAGAQFVNADGTGTGVGGPQTDSTNSYSSSLIDTHLSIGIIYAAAAVDIPLTTGHSLDSVANYVAMVTLAPTPLTVTPPAVPSILALFTSPPTETVKPLTAWDSAYLDALAHMAGNRKANRQRGQLVSAVTKAMKP
ncbi:hypothetical protein [Polymorphobacter fuscus]|uniref:DUF2927 domain-containing protein n=1 Tax=Sandarakinorhabdus fusca TaxID=1439888 RepID=A0A7C9GQV0_9SPHN|nr:hypothetical protein [Polymorphobacter fuscus]KAB7645498.1 hypothetical protein F9290_11745 [Polymorphobacter fuscus]MQT17930.1 hypothetical protein [Polymorphobacter fuscus]NJC08560.1 hypothetical protein [Polymorphobacter fuscus]